MAAAQQQQQQQQQLTLLQAQVGPPPASSAAAGASTSAPGSGPGGQAGPGQGTAGAGPLAVGQAPSGIQMAAQAQDFDPVQRFRLLLPQLKESLQDQKSTVALALSVDFLSSKNLMKVAAQNFVQNTNIDSGQKSNDGPVQRVDKSLEEFYALCDQLELCLRLAYECLSQSFDSAKHSPTLVPTATKPDAVQTESLPYTQYLSMIKSQISCAKDIHNALLECSNKITGKVPSQGVL